MAKPSEGGESQGFRLRRLAKPEELRAAEELQQIGASGSGESPVPVPVLRAALDNGGIVLGAFADIHLAGVTLGFLGWDGTTLYHYLHRLIVRPEYRNHGVGAGLALRLREEVQMQGLQTIRGTVEPLSSRAAFLAFHRLGARSQRYLPHHYGQQGGDEALDRESDRLSWSWSLDDPQVEALLARPRRPKPPEDPRYASAVPVVETEVGETGLRLPISVTEPTAPAVRLEVPFDVELVQQHEAASLRRWRHAARDAFRASFDAGYRVEGFEVVTVDHERRSSYLLARAPPEPSPPAATAGPP
jgi:predicted GNAT superfamily acetyltransferase